MTANCTNDPLGGSCEAKVTSSEHEHLVQINDQDDQTTDTQDNNGVQEDTSQGHRLKVGELQLCAHCVVMTGIVGVLFIFLGPILLPTMPTIGMAALIAGGVLAITSSVGCGIAYASQRRHHAMRLCLPERTAISRLHCPPVRNAIFSQPNAPPASHCHAHPYHRAPHPAVLNVPSTVPSQLSEQSQLDVPNEEPPSYSSLFPDKI